MDHRWFRGGAPGFSLAAFLFAAACGAGSETPTRELLALQQLAADAPPGVLHVQSPEAESLPAPYPGRSIDSSLYGPFRTRYPELAAFHDTAALGALYKFPLEKGRTAFILRVPSQYSSSAADLWIYDHARRAWLEPVHLADEFGDGCWHFTEDAWLLDLNHDGRLDIVRRRRDTWTDEVTTQKAHQSDSLWVQYGDSSGFRAPRISSDSLLRRRFDIPRWIPMTDGSC